MKPLDILSMAIVFLLAGIVIGRNMDQPVDLAKVKVTVQDQDAKPLSVNWVGAGETNIYVGVEIKK